MSDREKVIKGLEIQLDDLLKYADSDEILTLTQEQAKEIVALLKEQEPVEPYMDFDGHDVWRCGKCGATIFHIYHNASDEDAKNYAKFCRHCGRPVKW